MALSIRIEEERKNSRSIRTSAESDNREQHKQLVQEHDLSMEITVPINAAWTPPSSLRRGPVAVTQVVHQAGATGAQNNRVCQRTYLHARHTALHSLHGEGNCGPAAPTVPSQ